MLNSNKKMIWFAVLCLSFLLAGCGGEKIVLTGAQDPPESGFESDQEGGFGTGTQNSDQAAGVSGTAGMSGAAGVSGAAGTSGAAGASGVAGTSGAAGVSGVAGTSDTQGSYRNTDAAGTGNGTGVQSGRIAVHICGEVKQPGVYELPAGSRLEAALQAAGGFTEAADETCVNLAAAAADGSQIVVYAVGEAVPAQEGAVDSDGLVDLNRASKEELCTLPGIGETRAETILAYREEHGSFQKPEDLMRVSGIKEGSFAKLKDKIKVQ